MNQTAPATNPLPKPNRPSVGMMIIGGLLMASVLVPYLFWRGTWFGRRLTDRQMEQYLEDDGQPRHIQHALVQISDRITAGDESVEEWYPQVMALSQHPETEVRTTAAWVMGQDNTSGGFQEALRGMLDDAQPLVSRNAALSLVRFDDQTGKPEILAMLHPFVYRSPQSGKLLQRLEVSNTVSPGTMLARLETGSEKPVELRSPLPGTLREWLAEDGAEIEAGQPLLSLAPSKDQAWEALRALVLIGGREDLALINRIALGAYDLPQSVRQQAILTADAVQARMVEEAGKKTVGEE